MIPLLVYCTTDGVLYDFSRDVKHVRLGEGGESREVRVPLYAYHCSYRVNYPPPIAAAS
jgi:hypothetical protein